MSDRELLDIHHKDADFEHYWNGEPAGLKDPARSGIRFALLCKLAFTCGSDTVKAKRLAESSPFYASLDAQARKAWARLFPTEYDKAQRQNPDRYGEDQRYHAKSRSSENKVPLSAVSPTPDANWRDPLILNDEGKPRACLANILLALRLSKEWCGTLGFDEFSLEVVTRLVTPWNTPTGKVWADVDDSLATEWMQRHGIFAYSSKMWAKPSKWSHVKTRFIPYGKGLTPWCGTASRA
jgi:hypothetical protein